MAERLVQINPDQIAEVHRLLRSYPRGISKVMSRAVNKVSTASRQEISIEVRKRLSIKAGELKRRNLTLKRASDQNPTATIGIKGARIPLAKLSARQTKAGVTYRIGKTGPRKLSEHAFISNMPNGHRGVFKRKSVIDNSTPNKERSKWFIPGRSAGFDATKSNRLPIVELKGPSVPQVFQDIAQFAKAVHERKIATNLEKELVIQTNLILEGKTA